MLTLTSIFFLHEHIITYYKVKAEALEAARHFEECFHRTMAQAELNRNDRLSLHWDTEKQTIKCDVNAFGVIKLERKNNEIWLIIQDGNIRLKMQKDTFNTLCEYKESIEYLISFLEANTFSPHHGQKANCDL